MTPHRASVDAGSMTTTSGNPALSQESALEVLAFLVTAARTQTEEAAEYAPMRLLMGARALAQGMAPYVGDNPSLPLRISHGRATLGFIPLGEIPPL